MESVGLRHQTTALRLGRVDPWQPDPSPAHPTPRCHRVLLVANAKVFQLMYCIFHKACYLFVIIYLLFIYLVHLWF